MKNKTIVSFRTNEVEIELVKNSANLADSKLELAQKNIKNRLKVCRVFASASEQTLDLIVKHSSIEALEYLLNASNYKTAQRVLDCAKLLCNEKHSTILDYVIRALRANNEQSVAFLCANTTQCYSRVANAVKALAFFNLISVTNADVDSKNLIVKMSNNTVITLLNK